MQRLSWQLACKLPHGQRDSNISRVEASFSLGSSSRENSQRSCAACQYLGAVTYSWYAHFLMENGRADFHPLQLARPLRPSPGRTVLCAASSLRHWGAVLLFGLLASSPAMGQTTPPVPPSPRPLNPVRRRPFRVLRVHNARRHRGGLRR